MKLILQLMVLLIVVVTLAVLVCLPTGAELGEIRENGIAEKEIRENGIRENGTETSIRLFLRESEDGEGIIALEISLEAQNGIAALLCDLEYNPERVIYLSGGAADGEMHLSVLDFGGTVRLLLDAPENSIPRGALIQLYFKRIGGGNPGFALKCRDRALYLDRGGNVTSAPVEIVPNSPQDITPPTGATPPAGATPPTDTTPPTGDTPPTDTTPPADATPPTAPRLLSLEVCNGNLSFAVVVEESFAAGVRLFFVDLSGEGQHFEVLLAGVVGADGVLRGSYRPPVPGSYAVVVTALGYGRAAVTRGERRPLMLGRTECFAGAIAHQPPGAMRWWSPRLDTAGRRSHAASAAP